MDEAGELKFFTRSSLVPLDVLFGSIHGISHSGSLMTITLGWLGGITGGVQPVGNGGVTVVMGPVQLVADVTGGKVNGGVTGVTFIWHSTSQFPGINGSTSARKFARVHPPKQPGICNTFKGSRTEYS